MNVFNDVFVLLSKNIFFYLEKLEETMSRKEGKFYV